MKHVAFFLAVLMILSVALSACANEGKPDETAGNSPVSAPSAENGGGPEDGETEAGKTGRERVSDSLPDDLNYEGNSVIFYTNPYTPYACNFVEELTGDMLNDARYNTEAAVEERLNVAVEEEYGDQDPGRGKGSPGRGNGFFDGRYR